MIVVEINAFCDKNIMLQSHFVHVTWACKREADYVITLTVGFGLSFPWSRGPTLATPDILPVKVHLHIQIVENIHSHITNGGHWFLVMGISQQLEGLLKSLCVYFTLYQDLIW